MKTHQTEIDRRPFKSRAEREREAALETQYRSLALPAVVAAAGQAKSIEARAPGKTRAR